MVAEPIKITSLKAPPPGFTWDPDGRERKPQIQAQTRTTYYKFTPGGPRADAEPTDDLPTLTPGRDVLPTSCEHCGSALLSKESPLGQQQHGRISCVTCSRSLCWLTMPLAPPRLPLREEQPIEPPSAAQSVGLTPALGCSSACTWESGHDPSTHESYGRDRLLAEQEGRIVGHARIGPLFIDFNRADVEVEGKRVELTATEWRMLRCLAARPDRLVEYFELTSAAWDHRAAVLASEVYGRRGRFQTQRTHIARLRQKLGPAAALIETVKGIGLILNSAPRGVQ